jgi:inorganic triphosphatase YgiF
VETELKLALPPQQAERFVKIMARRHGAPVRQQVLTRYFDTPDWALSAQGIALRVRRVGRRWLQTLKTEGVRQGGLSRRAEYEMAITGGTPDWSRFPAEALARVPQALRAQLAPRFETRFSRTVWQLAGKQGAAIEVALDVGDVQAGSRRQPICEIELELKAGHPDSLFELALDWARQLDCLPLDTSKAERGVRLARDQNPTPVKSVAAVLDRRMSVEAGFAAMCQASLAQFQANLPGVLNPLPNPPPQAGEGANVMPTPINDIEYVHQARVALRRLRAALRICRPACVLPEELMAGLRMLAAALGPVRDWDVLCCETLPPVEPHFEDAVAWQQGMAALEAQRAAARDAMQAALAQARPGAWLLAFQRWLLRRGWRDAPEARRFTQLSPLAPWARRVLRKGQRRIVRDARACAELQAAQRHALRIVIKRQRYAAEFFQALSDKRRQPRYLAALCDAQDSLGHLNDARIGQNLVSLAQRDTGPMGSFVQGWLAAQQDGAALDASAGPVKKLLKFKSL